jgi:hypothetical protein
MSRGRDDFVVVCLPVFEVQPNCILDVAQSLIVGLSLAVTALERGAGDIEALRIAFDDNRQRVVLHADIVLREATPGVHRILLGWTGRWAKRRQLDGLVSGHRFSDAVSSSNQMPLLAACGKTQASYQGIALAMPQVLQIRCPFRGRAPTAELFSG